MRLFFGAVFISAEFTDISFEVKAVLCFYFYAFGDVFRRSRRFEFLYNQCNRLERKRLFPRNLTYLHHPSLDEVELRMASHPFPRAKRVKRMSADRSTRRGRMSSIVCSASEDRQAVLSREQSYTCILRSLSHPVERYIAVLSRERR